MGGTGTFTFTSGEGTTTLDLTCAVTSGGNVGVHQLNVTSAGTYSNEICGAGTADGSNEPPTVTSSLGNVPSVLWSGVDFDYHVSFVDGQGSLVFTAPSDVSGGLVSISPIDGPSGDDCAASWDLEGALAFVFVPSAVSDGTLHTNLIP